MRTKRAAAGILMVALTFVPATGLARAETDITLARFFGACEQAGTDIDAAVGEACIIEAIIDEFRDAVPDVDVVTLPTDWADYYGRIKALYAGRNAPDVHVMHASSLPEFAAIGALTALTGELEGAGIDPGDWTAAARRAVTYDGEIYGVPMDVHANVWHINLDILDEAGLVRPDGTPILPTSPSELIEHAKRVKSATGRYYLTADFAEFPIGVRLVVALVRQQGSDVFTETEAAVDTPEVRKAVGTIVSLFESGYANPRLGYNDSQQAFLSGEAAILVSGTWVVDLFNAQSADPIVPLDRYYAASFPTLFERASTWADAHLWVIPSTLQSDREKFRAALALLAWVNDHNVDWARTGHIAARKSVLESAAYASLPHRNEYASTADIAEGVAPTRRYGAIQDVLNRELQAIWLTGKPVDAALHDAERAIQSLLDR